eukprot:CAMPEP_0181442286 /NCGR_PEP_ID=MMETSP1110-20121109/23948_1 /TAXON_ID=174948 /ORGANISM="Symbiodinium sp., Strain CCMP421" /LENGTH=38 /DNA_ID= /DNA_START= /DNA_END= /DNA_ORIENTATION=
MTQDTLIVVRAPAAVEHECVVPIAQKALLNALSRYPGE